MPVTPPWYRDLQIASHYRQSELAVSSRRWVVSVLEEIGTAVSGAAEQVGPAVVGMGRGWGRGSGVGIGQGTVLTNRDGARGGAGAGSGRGGGRGSGVVTARDAVLTNAHVLRGEEVAVRVGGADEAAHGKVAGI